MMRAVDGLELAARRRRAPGARAREPDLPGARARSGTGSSSRTSRSRIPSSSRADPRARRPAAARRRGRRARRRERRRQDDAREADRPLLRADARHDHARRRGHPPLRARRVAREPHGRLPGLRAARGARARDGRRRRPAEPRRDAGRRGRARARARRATSSRRCRTGLETPLGRIVGERQRALRRPVAEARARPGDDARPAARSCCSTSRRRRSTPTPSTCSSSATPRRAREAARTTGAITLLVSHRFSTVRMADLILVVDGGRDRRERHARGADARSAARTPSSTGCRLARTASLYGRPDPHPGGAVSMAETKQKADKGFTRRGTRRDEGARPRAEGRQEQGGGGDATCSRRSPRCRKPIASWPSGSTRSSRPAAPGLSPRTWYGMPAYAKRRQGRLLLPERGQVQVEVRDVRLRERPRTSTRAPCGRPRSR